MAGGSMGEELFNRGKSGYDSDFLDDSALITAFDNAINPIKAMLGDTQLTDVAANRGGHVPPKKKKKKKHKRNRNKSLPHNSSADCGGKWRVGSHCRCKYNEDGLIYDATVISIDDDGETCTVRYDYYNNEEQQRISDLLPPPRASDSCQHSSSMQSDLESADGAESMQDVPQKGSFKPPQSGADRRQAHKSKKSSDKPRLNKLPQFMPPGFPFPFMPPFPHMQAPFSHAPPAFTRMPPSFHRVPPPFQHMSGVPLIPPPPPPPMMSDDDSTELDKEALYNMLISWYMSGYHTGYYEGLKRGHRRPPAEDDEDEDGDSTSAETASSVKEHR